MLPQHVVNYAVIRIKVAVGARDYRSAMKAADAMLSRNGVPVALQPVAAAVLKV